MKRISHGFSLIELMIVVAIIGILTTVALPAFQDYTIRAKVTELILNTAGFKTLISTKSQNDGTIASAGAGLTISTGGRIASGSVALAGLITLAGNAASLGTDVTITLTPSVGAGGRLAWSCGTGTTGQWRFVPAECRH